MLSNLRLINVIHIIYFEYLCNFDAPVLFLGLVCGGIVVPSTVEIDKLSVSLSNTCLDERKHKKKMWMLFIDDQKQAKYLGYPLSLIEGSQLYCKCM